MHFLLIIAFPLIPYSGINRAPLAMGQPIGAMGNPLGFVVADHLHGNRSADLIREPFSGTFFWVPQWGLGHRTMGLQDLRNEKNMENQEFDS